LGGVFCGVCCGTQTERCRRGMPKPGKTLIRRTGCKTLQRRDEADTAGKKSNKTRGGTGEPEREILEGDTVISDGDGIKESAGGQRKR